MADGSSEGTHSPKDSPAHLAFERDWHSENKQVGVCVIDTPCCGEGIEEFPCSVERHRVCHLRPPYWA